MDCMSWLQVGVLAVGVMCALFVGEAAGQAILSVWTRWRGER